MHSAPASTSSRCGGCGFPTSSEVVRLASHHLELVALGDELSSTRRFDRSQRTRAEASSALKMCSHYEMSGRIGQARSEAIDELV